MNKRTLKGGPIGILVGIIATMITVVVQPSNAASEPSKPVEFPKSVPTQARASFESEPTPAVSPNVYLSYYYDSYQDEYVFHAEHYDSTTEYGWTECVPSQCGKIVLGKGGKIRLVLRDTETLVYSNYSYQGEQDNTGTYYGGLMLGNNWDPTIRLALDEKIYWQKKSQKLDFAYASVALSSSSFETPQYPPCCGSGK